MIATTRKELAVLMAATAAMAIVGASATTFTVAEAQIAIKENGVKVAEGQIAQEAGHWGTVSYIDQDACTNETNAMKKDHPRDNSLTGDQVQEVGTQSTECGEVTQSAEINNSVIDESTTNDESTSTSNIEMGDPIPDIG
jgi:hypothetical protein